MLRAAGVPVVECMESHQDASRMLIVLKCLIKETFLRNNQTRAASDPNIRLPTTIIIYPQVLTINIVPKVVT